MKRRKSPERRSLVNHLQSINAGATRKQISYLASLLLQNNIAFSAVETLVKGERQLALLTFDDASALIDSLVKSQRLPEAIVAKHADHDDALDMVLEATGEANW